MALLLAAIAGVVTVVAGMLIVLGSPEEYGLASQRDHAAASAQPEARPRGAGEPAMFQAAPDVPPPLPSLPAAPAMQPSTPVRDRHPEARHQRADQVGRARQERDDPGAAGHHRNLVGWYRNMSTPGEAGPAVLLGHKDTRTRSAVFSRLHEIRNGDTIEVKRQDGITAVFTVGGLEQAGKTTFPTERVYGPRTNAQLHLITCGGVYNRRTGHYTDNVIVYATMTSSYRS